MQNYPPQYFSKMYTGIYINIIGNYSPVQSRTRIIMPPATQYRFETAIKAGIMAKIVNEVSEGAYEKIPNFNSKAFVSIDGMIRGHFNMETSVRAGVPALVNNLPDKMQVSLLSGDQGSDEERMKNIFPSETVLHFLVNFFYTSTGFDNNRKGMLIGYACVSTFIPASR